jgi:hypothetical protein
LKQLVVDLARVGSAKLKKKKSAAINRFVDMFELKRIAVLQITEARWGKIIPIIDDINHAISKKEVVSFPADEIFNGPLKFEFKDDSVIRYVRPDLLPRLEEFYKRLLARLSWAGINEEELRFSPSILITSTVRDMKEQNRLVAAGYPAAKGTRSAHLRGLAADLSLRKAFSALLDSFEFRNREFGSLDKARELIDKIVKDSGVAAPSILSVNDAVKWLNQSMEPFEIFIKLKRGGYLSDDQEKLIEAFIKMINDEERVLIEQENWTALVKTMGGQGLKRAILESLYSLGTSQNLAEKIKSLYVFIGLSNRDRKRMQIVLKSIIKEMHFLVRQMEREGKIHYITEFRNSKKDIWGRTYRPVIHFAAVPSDVYSKVERGNRSVVPAMQVEPAMDMNSSDVRRQASDELGGIDLNTDRLDMFIKGNAGNFDMELTDEQLHMLQQEVTGFVPVIIDVKPMKSVPGFLGMRKRVSEASVAS